MPWVPEIRAEDFPPTLGDITLVFSNLELRNSDFQVKIEHKRKDLLKVKDGSLTATFVGFNVIKCRIRTV